MQPNRYLQSGKTNRRRLWTGLTLVAVCVSSVHAAEVVTLRNGFDLVCDHRESHGSSVRLYLSPDSSNFVEFGAAEIARIDTQPATLVMPLPTAMQTGTSHVLASATVAHSRPSLTPSELHEILASAGTQHNLEVDLLASVVHAESGGNARAVSRTGARGLMQLMPATASQLGVSDSFQPSENVRGGAAYLDSLLAKYNDNLALALAAYNAGPAAVARWHGVPPYRETRAYVARVIREFNSRSPSAYRTKRLVPGGPSMAAALTPANLGGGPVSSTNQQPTQ